MIRRTWNNKELWKKKITKSMLEPVLMLGGYLSRICESMLRLGEYLSSISKTVEQGQRFPC